MEKGGIFPALFLFKKGLPMISAFLTLSRQRAVTLIEATLYLLVTLMILVGGLVFFNQASLAVSVGDLQRQVSSLQSEVRGLFREAGFGSPETELNDYLITAGAVPTSTTEPGTDNLRHPWGGEIFVRGENQVFTVEIEAIPSTACARLAVFNSAGVGPVGTAIQAVSIDATRFEGELSLQDAAAACVSPDEQVDITWEFRR